jgi:hypothetical protein
VRANGLYTYLTNTTSLAGRSDGQVRPDGFLHPWIGLLQDLQRLLLIFVSALPRMHTRTDALTQIACSAATPSLVNNHALGGVTSQLSMYAPRAFSRAAVSPFSPASAPATSVREPISVVRARKTSMILLRSGEWERNGVPEARVAEAGRQARRHDSRGGRKVSRELPHKHDVQDWVGVSKSAACVARSPAHARFVKLYLSAITLRRGS